MPTDCTDYDFTKIEPRWQEFWEQNHTFRAIDGSNQPKFYALDMFPYPSGAGLHIGHPEGYTASDILARYKRACGHNVLHPMGWDAFGLPAEQYAVKTGTHPKVTTQANVDNFRRQIKRFGFSIDWEREINTTDPEYYRWTQWIFLQLFKHGLAYVDERPVWWCPNLRAVLANEEVVDGKSEVGNHPVERRNLRQFVLRITAYADKLLAGLEGLDWPDSTKRQQKAWIGRSEGGEVEFEIDGLNGQRLTVYTTRPDTLFGATYMVLAPEHPLVAEITTETNKKSVQEYIRQAALKSDLDRTDLAKEKSGVPTGGHCINPVNGQKIPVWVADYVLMGYGTGAIMAVPAHDDRDYEFAKQFGIEVVQVIKSENDSDVKLPFCEKGKMINSGEFDGLESDEGKRRILDKLEKEGRGRNAVNYKLRDWIFSRQRYWGEPIPVVWVSKDDYEYAATSSGPVRNGMPDEPVKTDREGQTLYALPIPPSHLPLRLPEVENYQPSGTGESPLATLPEWLNIWFNIETGEVLPRDSEKPQGDVWVEAIRETNTMPQWAGSCWYHLRYLDPKNSEAPVDLEKEKYWGSPDFYIGGAEHAVLHLLYARFWHIFLHDIGAVSTPEPYQRLFHQGLILGEDGNKMSKSIGNVVNPDEVIDSYGADALRLYEMFLGPLEAVKPWNTKGIEGVSRFLRKVWREILDREGKLQNRIHENSETSETEKVLHETIKKVTEDIENLRFNTAISQLMILLNHIQKAETLSLATVQDLLRMLAPMAPHIAEELWERTGGQPSILNQGWPQFDESKLGVSDLTIIFQVNGKLRGEGTFPESATKEEIIETAKTSPRVKAQLEGKTLRKEIYVPGKIVNLVAN